MSFGAYGSFSSFSIVTANFFDYVFCELPVKPRPRSHARKLGRPDSTCISVVGPAVTGYSFCSSVGQEGSIFEMHRVVAMLAAAKTESPCTHNRPMNVPILHNTFAILHTPAHCSAPGTSPPLAVSSLALMPLAKNTSRKLEGRAALILHSSTEAR